SVVHRGVGADAVGDVRHLGPRAHATGGAPGRHRHRLCRCARAHPADPAKAGEWAVTDVRVEFGRRTLRLRRGLWMLVDVRSILACVVLAALTTGIALVGLASGDYQLSLREVVIAVFGYGDPFAYTVVMEWRMPRVLASIVFGAGLGVSGAIFQSLTRNPLASPDIVGFSAGSYTG